MTITTLDDRIRKQIEPFASSIESRLSALRKLKENGLITYIFIGPILPHLTNWKAIIAETKNYIDCFMFENLNMHGTISNDVYSWIDKYHPKLHNEYTTIRQRGMTYWDDIEQEIKQYCNSKGVSFKIYFDHKKYRKT